MPQDATCPKCSHTFPVTEARHAVTVTCPRCEAELTAEFKKPAAPPEAGQPPYDLLVKAGAVPGSTASPPPPRRKKDEDDDEPRRKGGSAMVVLLSGGLGLLFVLGGLGVTAWFLFYQMDTSSTSTVNRSTPNTNKNTPNRVVPAPNIPGRNQPGPNFNPGPDNNPPPTEPKPKKDTFDLRPVPAPRQQIKAPNIDPTFLTQIPLPGKAGAVAVGGGGRYVVFHIPQPGRLVVFDANTGGLLGDGINTEAGDIQMAAGGTKLLTTVPGGRQLRVYSLPDLSQLKQFESPLGVGGVRAIAMGALTNGPAFVSDGFAVHGLVDINSGKLIDGSQTELTTATGAVRAAADGKSFLVAGRIASEEKFKLLDVDNNRKWRLRDMDIAMAYPANDGLWLYGKDQIVTNQGGVQVAGKPAGLQPLLGHNQTHVWYVPATTANARNSLYLRVNLAQAAAGKQKVLIGVHRDHNVETPVIPAVEAAEADQLVHAWGGSEPLDRHLFLIPEAKLLVVLNKDKTRLTVRKINI